MADILRFPNDIRLLDVDQGAVTGSDRLVVGSYEKASYVFFSNQAGSTDVMDFTVAANQANLVISPDFTLGEGTHARFTALDSTLLSTGEVVFYPIVESLDFTMGTDTTLEYVEPSSGDSTSIGSVNVDMTAPGTSFIYTPSDVVNHNLLITNFGSQDIIQVVGAASSVLDGSQLVFRDAEGNVIANFDMEGISDPSMLRFDGGTVSYACYLKGTHIATPGGEVKIETLRAGDKVTTASGGVATVKWVGYRTLYRRSIPASHAAKAFPILFKRDSLADNVPHRDLMVSPWHHLFFDGMLVPAFALVNGKTIVQQLDMAKFQYFHLELESFDILLAEGVPAESYVDTGNRSMFQNAATVSLRANFEPPVGRQKIPGIRIVRQGAPVQALQQALLDRANWLEETSPAPEEIRRQA